MNDGRGTSPDRRKASSSREGARLSAEEEAKAMIEVVSRSAARERQARLAAEERAMHNEERARLLDRGGSTCSGGGESRTNGAEAHAASSRQLEQGGKAGGGEVTYSSNLAQSPPPGATSGSSPFHLQRSRLYCGWRLLRLPSLRNIHARHCCG